jgi:hypothetical protein
MSTRGFLGFVIDQAEKIAYNNYDSYPDGLGLAVLDWLQGMDREVVEDQVRKIRVVASDTTPTDADIERLLKYADVVVGSNAVNDWYVLLRKTQGKPGLMLEAGVIQDASEFPADSLWAEWGYIIDFDQGVFEVYRGFQKAPHSRGRFAHLTGSDGYVPVALVATWSLGDLPDHERFLAAIAAGEDERHQV